MSNTNYFSSANHVLIGLGGTGGKILRAFKMRMYEEFPTEEERNKIPVALLYIDSTDEMMPQEGRPRPDFRVMGQDASFTPLEFLNIKAVDVAYMLDHIGNYPSLKGIVDNVDNVKSAIGSLGQAAGQMRRAGRLLFAANAKAYVNSLENAFARCFATSGNETKKYIHIFAGLCGGTGSGSIIDAIVQARKKYPDAIISVYAMIPEMNLPKSNMDQGRYYPNGYAAVNELNALQAGLFTPQDVTGNGNACFYSDRRKGVADGITIYSNVNGNGVTVNSLTELPKIISDYIFARIFFINEDDQEHFNDILRAYNYENMDMFALEFDESADPDGVVPPARTKKVNSIGIKRVMYPELRVLKHITYTVGESILYQFKYNNWRENIGFVAEERNRDYRRDFLNNDNLAKWMIDYDHLTLDQKILKTDPDEETIKTYWHDKAIGYDKEAKKADCPLNELDNIMAGFYNDFFREDGVLKYYTSKEKAIPEMAKEIRHKIEAELFDKWKDGELSIVELQKVSKLLCERINDLKKELEEKSKEEKDNLAAWDQDRQDNVSDWGDMGYIKLKVLGKADQLFGDHQRILEEYYTSKTMLVALEFAKKLTIKVSVEIGKMDSEISSFGQAINDAIEETEKLIGAQQKVNKGLEDMKGAIVEVSEDELMVEFENDIKTSKTDMINIANEIRRMILPQGEFVNFGKLTNEISIDDIKDVFDVKLSLKVKEKHGEKGESDKKVLGMNILTQLQQKKPTDDDIKEFATKIVKQSEVYLKLNEDQMHLNLRNNEGDLSPSNPASVNKKTILVSIPSDDGLPGLKKYADKLVDAFSKQFGNNASQNSIIINRQSPRKDELSIITIQYCFPMRAIEWLTPYKQRYDEFLNSGNKNTDLKNSILLHSEGYGKNLPSLFALSDAEIAAKDEERRKEQQAKMNLQAAATINNPATTTESAVMPSAGAPTPPPLVSTPPVPPIAPQPELKIFIAIGGQQYGPYNMDLCKQMVQNGQLTPQTMVWKEGLPAWTPASQVPELQILFMPPTPTGPAMPPLPPTGGPTPPPMM